MKIAIIGGGSIGLLYAHYLSKFHRVFLYVRTKEQKFKIVSEGLIFEKNDSKSFDSIHTTEFSNWKGDEDITIIAVKQYHLQSVLSDMMKVVPFYAGTLLFLQNGMGHLKWLETITARNIYIGSVDHGANKLNFNHVIHTGNGVTKLAHFKGQEQSAIKEMINPLLVEFPFTFEDDFKEMLQRKLIVNAVINPLTAVLNVRNGDLLVNPHYYHTFKELFEEICIVLNIEDKMAVFSYIKNVCRKTSANRSSMLKDIDEKRPTEVDAILGYVLEKARENEINAPLTEVFFHLIKGKEYKREEG
ncbi:2-dehydropantoate 2-reductase [Cytobacillus dafuensis]|uniref:2-dehydropantoate 2-reductase n=1 Tax=Cytobacillus dafuensis TaxID=1742359 RepID=A0A5B8Z3A1_CYTDA|nr:2-dehydropantoate 2-reductase [Cytobacillus dafuensis]QED47438.1 2-dehydropantoate 2-reductase [Cytobacillus dafuensis]